ncbi:MULTISPECIES: FixH family protein [Caulobacter]|jgi:nitrogen fixation protein FixH|uniref:Putative integral membrane protein linked to a cation pump n=1 Tax=Caulobacter vibrioides OR37 TaxID=1292034 RepID=R0E700_CAUVI|nr:MULTISPECIES: FixH family protein [Caulobacter]ENZ81283.1 putative integral membrane protein linked to a cation pump [Caulobacter vibrioides OR37]MBQ1560026.1 FixH family protein [Caulobacter sp.]
MTAAVSSVAKPGPEKGRITGWHVLIAVVLFFGVVIGVDTVFMVKAYSTFSGEVASNPYEAGLAFNKTLDQRRRETALGWKTGVSTAGGQSVVVTVEDRAGKPLDHLSVTGVLERPATETGRQVLNFRPIGQGRYEAPARLDGAWDLRGAARNSGDMVEIETRLVTP